MATIALDAAVNPQVASSFMRLPGELRNAIYHCHFEDAFESQGLEANSVCGRVESLRPALNVLRACRTIRNEASSLFWIDHVTRCHWSFGARHDDDDRMASFCEAARKYTYNVDITFQKRHLDTSSMLSNTVWLVLQSAIDLTKDEGVLRKLREEWRVKHQNLEGFVWVRSINVGPHDNTMIMNYTYHPNERSWVQFRGHLAVLEWRKVLTLADIGAEVRL